MTAETASIPGRWNAKYARTMQRRLMVVGLLLTACGGSADARSQAHSVPPLRDAKLLGRLTSPALVEASGVVRSTRETNVFWSQNDSGNDEFIFAYDSTGKALGGVRIANAKNRDWEAIAIGPCPSGSCLYIGDVGDNLSRRKAVRVYRVPEPLTTDTVSIAAERLDFQYADGPRDVESMWIGADSGMYFVTKRPTRDSVSRLEPARLYQLLPSRWGDSAIALAQFIDTVPITPKTGNDRSWISDAAISQPDSTGKRRIAIRTYTDIYVFRADSTGSRPSGLLGRCSVKGLKGAAGEGITFLPDGRLLINSEGAGSRLYAGYCP